MLLLCRCVFYYIFFFFFKQKTAYEMRISDWSSDVCSSDLLLARRDDDGIFGGVVARIRLAAETHEPVGFARHRRDDDRDLVALRDFARDELRHGDRKSVV